MALEFPAPILQARRARGHLIIGGQDILLGLASQHILSFGYTDSTSDKADDLHISLADPDRTWMFRYLPADAKRGVECEASITLTDWRGPGDNVPFDCGIFYINYVGFSLFPNVVDIKATSIPLNGIKNEKKFRAWENAQLKSIAGQIAQERGLELFYDTEQNPKVKRTEQKDRSDLEYLREACKEAQLSMKVHKKRLVIYSEEEYEARPPAFTLRYGESHLLDASFDANSDDTFDESVEQYVNPETGKLTEERFKPWDSPEGTTALLRSSEAIYYEEDDPSMRNIIIPSPRQFTDDWSKDNPAANKGKGKGGKKRAKDKAKAKLREKNKKEKKCSITTFGNINYLSGLNFQTEGFGIFDLKWFIEASSHEVQDGGYTTSLSCRHTLNY